MEYYLDDKQWEAFLEILDRPVDGNSKLRKLLADDTHE